MPKLLLTCAFLEGIALTLIQGYLPLYVRRALGEPSYFMTSLVVAVPALGTAIGSNFWGGLSDVAGRLKPMILIGTVGYALALIGIPELRGSLAVLALVGGASLLYGTLGPTLKAYATLARPDRRENAIATLILAYSAGWLTGSYGGGWLLEGGLASGLKDAMWSAAALTALNAVVVLRLLPDWRRTPPARGGRGGWAAGVLADLAGLYENRALLRLCVLAFFFVAGNYLMWGFFTVFLVEHLGASIGIVRHALAASSILGIIALPFVGPLVRRVGGTLALAIGTTLYLFMYSGMGAARDPLLVSVFFAIPLYGLVNVSANVLASEYASVAQRGGGFGVLQGAYAVATVAGPLTGGIAADRLGLGIVPWAAFGFMAVACPLAWLAATRRPGAAPEASPRPEPEEMRVDAG